MAGIFYFSQSVVLWRDGISKRMASVFAFIKQRYCKHLFKGRELQPRNEKGNVTWKCCKCEKVFEAECGLDILRYGKCDGIYW